MQFRPILPHVEGTRLEASLNLMAHAQKPDFVFRRNGQVTLNQRGRQFSRLLAAEVCASAVVMLGTPCSEVEWRVLVTHSIRQFPLYIHSRASPCAITFQLDCTFGWGPRDGLDAVEGRKVLCPPPGIEFQFLNCTTRSYCIEWFMTIAHRCVKHTSDRSSLLIQRKIFILAKNGFIILFS